MARRRPYGSSGCRTSSLTSVTAICPRYPLFDDKRTEHRGGMDIALEVVAARLDRIHLVRLRGHAREEVRGRIRPAQPGAAVARVLREDLDVVRHAGVLVVERERERRVRRRRQAVRVELDLLRDPLPAAAGG